MQHEPRWICIGTVGKAHGLRGHFYLSQREGPLDFKSGEVRIGPDPLQPSLSTKLIQQMPMGDKLVIRCEAITSREDLAPLVSQPVWVARDKLQAADNDTLLWADLIGRHVIDCDGVTLGQIDAVHNFGASDILAVIGVNGKRLNIPFIAHYVHLPIAMSEQTVHLVVPGADFAEFWQ